MDLEHFRRIAAQARARGLIQGPDSASLPLPAPEAGPPVPVEAGVAFDYVLINKVFGFAINSRLSPMRVYGALVRRLETMTPAERAAVPVVALEMLQGLKAAIAGPAPAAPAGSVPVRATVQEDGTVRVEAASAPRFPDLMLRLERSLAWHSFRTSLDGIEVSGSSLVLHGGAAAACAARGDAAPVRLLLEAVQRFPATLRCHAAAIMEAAA